MEKYGISQAKRHELRLLGCLNAGDVDFRVPLNKKPK
jgi:hypothetical protein